MLSVSLSFFGLREGSLDRDGAGEAARWELVEPRRDFLCPMRLRRMFASWRIPLRGVGVEEASRSSNTGSTLPPVQHDAALSTMKGDTHSRSLTELVALMTEGIVISVLLRVFCSSMEAGNQPAPRRVNTARLVAAGDRQEPLGRSPIICREHAVHTCLSASPPQG